MIVFLLCQAENICNINSIEQELKLREKLLDSINKKERKESKAKSHRHESRSKDKETRRRAKSPERHHKPHKKRKSSRTRSKSPKRKTHSSSHRREKEKKKSKPVFDFNGITMSKNMDKIIDKKRLLEIAKSNLSAFNNLPVKIDQKPSNPIIIKQCEKSIVQFVDFCKNLSKENPSESTQYISLPGHRDTLLSNTEPLKSYSTESSQVKLENILKQNFNLPTS